MTPRLFAGHFSPIAAYSAAEDKVSRCLLTSEQRIQSVIGTCDFYLTRLSKSRKALSAVAQGSRTISPKLIFSGTLGPKWNIINRTISLLFLHQIYRLVVELDLMIFRLIVPLNITFGLTVLDPSLAPALRGSALPGSLKPVQPIRRSSRFSLRD